MPLSDLLFQVQSGDRKAADRLVRQFTLLIHKQINRHLGKFPTHAFDDAFQTACLALWIAAKSFNPNKGASFMSWASQKVSGAILNYGGTFLLQKNQTDPLEHDPLSPSDIWDNPRHQELLDILAQVAGDSLPLLLAHLEGASFTTLAKQEGLSVSTMRHRLLRLKTKAKAAIALKGL